MKKDLQNSTIEKLIFDQNMFTKSDIARFLGFTPSHIYNKIRRESWTFDEIVLIANLLGFSVEFVSRDPDQSFTVIPGEDDRKKINELVDKKYQELINDVKRLEKMVNVEESCK